MTTRRDDIRSWGVSIGAHLLLLLLAWYWQAFGDLPRIPEAIEIIFAAPAEEPAVQPEPVPQPVPRISTQPATPTTRTPRTTTPQRPAATPQPRADARQPARTPTRQQAATQSTTTQQAAGTDRPVPPPQLRSREPVVLSEPGTGKSDASSGRTTGFESRGDSREAQLPGATSAERDRAGSGVASRTASDGGQLSGTPTSSANIDWGTGLARSRIAGSLPSFPPGATREATIKVRFTVRPNGTVTALTLMQKGEPLFEQAALAAMRGWKFNALPASVEQQDQQGVATFVFKLK